MDAERKQDDHETIVTIIAQYVKDILSVQLNFLLFIISAS